jgi:hypothetical protein
MTELEQEQERIAILTSAIEQRKREILHYQINIDNYMGALALINEKYSDNTALEAFVAQLENLLESSLVEQTKEKIMLEVIERQLND